MIGDAVDESPLILHAMLEEIVKISAVSPFENLIPQNSELKKILENLTSVRKGFDQYEFKFV
jgi:hypothetical protein